MFLSSLRSRATAVIAAAIIASCAMQPVPALSTEQPSFCQVATEYNLNWHSLLNRGATVEQVVQMHIEVMQEKGNNLPAQLIDVLNYMLYLTTINVATDSDVTAQGLYDSCNKAIQQVISSKKRDVL